MKGSFYTVLVSIGLMLAVMGCNKTGKGGNSDLSHRLDSIVVDTAVVVVKNADTSYCTLRLNIKTIKGKHAEVANRALLGSGILTPDYLSLADKSLTARQAVDSFVAQYIDDCKTFYVATAQENRMEYVVDTWTENGRNGIVNYYARIGKKTGSQSTDYTLVRNLDLGKKRILSLRDLLVDGYERDLCKAIGKQLEKQLESPIDSLLKNGLFANMGVYATDNVVMGEDQLTFIYVEGEIADRAKGEIRIGIDYSDIADLIRR